MRKLFKSIVFVAVAAIALGSCQKNELDGLVKKDFHFYINANVPETKTLITDKGDGSYTPSWKKGDKIGIFFTEPTEDVEITDAIFSNILDDGSEATFEGSANVTADGTLYAFYPSSAFKKHYGDGTIRLDLNAEQKPSSTSFDPNCDILLAWPYDYSAEGETVVIDELYFTRLMSVLKINLLGDFAKDEVVESLTFEVAASANVNITGNAVVDYKKAEITKWNNGSVKKNTITATYSSEECITVAGTNNASYLVVAPVRVPAGTELTFKIKTANYNITKTVTVKEEKPLAFPAGDIAVINLTINEDDCEAIDTSIDYSGLYAILTKRSSGDYYYMTNDLGTASTKRLTAVSAGADLPVEGVVLGPSKLWEVSKSGDFYTVKSLESEKYITWTSGNSANLGSTGIKFTIEKNEDGTYKFSYAGGDETRYLSLNGTSGNDYFALYKSGQRMDLNLIPAVEGEEPAVLEVVTPSQISADGGSGSFTYTLKNPKDGVQLEAETESEWITDITISDGAVSYTVAPNEIEEVREGLITLTYGELTKDITISQAAWEEPNTGGDDESTVAPSGTVLWAETWADAGSTSTAFASNSAISTYNYSGRTGFEDNATNVTYTADASNNVRITKSSGGNCTSGHLWFNKSVAGEFKTSEIKLYGATSLSFSHSQGTNGSSCQTLYSIDGGTTWTSLGTQSGAIATKTYTFTVSAGTESIMIKLTHASSNSKNTRVDNLVLKVK